MRSVRYRLFGSPKNQSDCVDYAKENKIVRIIVVPMWGTETREDDVVTTLYGSYIWIFEKKATVYDQVFSKLFGSEGDDRQISCVDNANRRMRSSADDLSERMGIRVEGGKSHFAFQDANKLEVIWVPD